MKRSLLIDVIASLLILLFVYTSVSKWLDLPSFVIQMRMQTLPPAIQTLLIRTLPAVEILTAGLLLFNSTKRIGVYVSAGLMSFFTVYVMLVLLHAFHSVPCSCGGVLKSMNWVQHLYFNIFFLLLSLLGIYLIDRERRAIPR